VFIKSVIHKAISQLVGKCIWWARHHLLWNWAQFLLGTKAAIAHNKCPFNLLKILNQVIGKVREKLKNQNKGNSQIELGPFTFLLSRSYKASPNQCPSLSFLSLPMAYLKGLWCGNWASPYPNALFAGSTLCCFVWHLILETNVLVWYVVYHFQIIGVANIFLMQ
jgi:hypothetical protein